jgi:predicted ATP-grasp superfamily ATP-dependent carboligase
MRHRLNQAFTVLLLVASGLAVYNVFGDPSEVQAQARAVACGEGVCTISSFERSPFSQNYEITLKNGKTMRVVCRRAAILVGAYSCHQP